MACDIARVPLEDGSLDVAVFSLSLMGSNFTEYLREAHRTLKLDGWLHIIESTARFGEDGALDAFIKGLKALGFGNVQADPVSKFTHISARKTERPPRAGVVLRFR